MAIKNPPMVVKAKSVNNAMEFPLVVSSILALGLLGASMLPS